MPGAIMRRSFLRCLLNLHAPDAHSARWNGIYYAGTCTRCGKPIRRIRKGWWVSDGKRR